MTSICRPLAFIALLGCALPGAVRAADPPAVGMVLDVQGAVQVIDKGRTSPLQLLARLAPETRLELPAQSRASVTLYGNRSVYRLTGPAVVEVSRDDIKVVRGQAAEVKAMGEKQVAAAPMGALVTGAYRMRNIQPVTPMVLTSPENGTVLLDTRPEFAWDGAPDARFKVSLQQQGGGPTYGATVSGNRWALPEGTRLRYGAGYVWSVTAADAAGEPATATGRFSLATQAEVDQFIALQPAEADPIEDWVYYAALLQQRQVRTEARKAWQRIARERPDLQRAADLARQP
jgi:hypothetical protein